MLAAAAPASAQGYNPFQIGAAGGIAFPTGDLDLTFCAACGFVFNRIFDASRMHYCSQCEESMVYRVVREDRDRARR